MSRVCPDGHEISGDNAMPRELGSHLFRCRICRYTDRQRSDWRRRGKIPPLTEEDRKRVATLGLYEDYLALKGRGVTDYSIAEKLGVSKGSLYRVKKKFGPTEGD